MPEYGIAKDGPRIPVRYGHTWGIPLSVARELIASFEQHAPEIPETVHEDEVILIRGPVLNEEDNPLVPYGWYVDVGDRS